MAPRWSPDGTQVVFAGLAGTNTLTGNTKIWIVDRDGSNLTAIYDEPFAVFGPVVYGTARCPQFSDDGTKIMFLRDGEVTPITGGTTTQRQIYTMDPDGSNLVQVALTTAYTSSVAGYTSHIPCWLSGTTTIVYYDTSTGDQTSGYGEWWMVEADGTGATLLYTDPESTASYTATGGGPWGPTAFASLPDASGALALQWFPGDTLYFDQRLGFVDFFGGGWFEISPTEVSAGFQYNINVPVFEKDGRIWWDDGMLGSGGNGVCSVLLDGSNFTVEDNSETWFWF
jgi:hypothetical protein